MSQHEYTVGRLDFSGQYLTAWPEHPFPYEKQGINVSSLSLSRSLSPPALAETGRVVSKRG